jgi:hypothetical protein
LLPLFVFDVETVDSLRTLFFTATRLFRQSLRFRLAGIPRHLLILLNFALLKQPWVAPSRASQSSTNLFGGVENNPFVPLVLTTRRGGTRRSQIVSFILQTSISLES